MRSRVVIGLAVVAAGALLLVLGIDVEDHGLRGVPERLENVPSDKAIWLITLGAFAAATGLAMLVVPARGRGRRVGE